VAQEACVSFISIKAVARADRFHPALPSIRHMLSSSNLTRDDVDALCEAAQAFEHGRSRPPALAGLTVSLLFFQPSTRTRLGFEAAAVALGCHAIGMQDMSASRSNKRSGETLEDCGAVMSNLSDAIVLRHHETGAAARIATRSQKPVINAGDGWNEHPTQALSDIFALRRGLGNIAGKSLAFCGDPRGRTVRSLVQLLRHERPAEILFCPPVHIAVPPDITASLDKAGLRYRIIQDVRLALLYCDALMMAPFDMSDIGEIASSDYISPRATPDSHVITADAITSTQSATLLYHPLPRLDELDPSCDDLPNARYFEQVRLSKFMRMAILERSLL
jgi:aspartate carbamoyltransferase catalytic subunit